MTTSSPCALSALLSEILLFLNTFLKYLELSQIYRKVASTAQRHFLFLNYRVPYQLGTPSPPNTLVCNVLQTRSCHAQPFRATIQGRKLKSIPYCHASCRPHWGYTRYPDNALYGEGIYFWMQIAFSYLCSLLRLDQFLSFPWTWPWHSWRSQASYFVNVPHFEFVWYFLMIRFKLYITEVMLFFFLFSLGLLSDGRQLWFAPFLMITYFDPLIILVSAGFLYCKVTVFPLELVSFIGRELEAVNILFFI